MICLDYRKKRIISRKREITLSENIKTAFATITIVFIIMAILGIFTLHFLPKNGHLYGEYLAQTIPLYNIFNPREEDIVRKNVSLAALNYLMGINLTRPTSILKTQIPVFNQWEYVQIVIPEKPSVIERHPIEEPTEPIDLPQPREKTLEGRRILIYHSHTTEAFVPTSGIPHTENFEETIVRVGEYLTKALEAKGATVIHDKTHHSKRPHSDSYRRSRETVRRHLEEGEFDLIIDLHRDGVGNSSEIGRPITTADINGVTMGRLLFIVGQRHERWRSNYALAQKMVSFADQMYPNLTRRTGLKPSGNYNQDLNDRMVLIEIGGHWNTLEEAINTVGPLANIIEKTIGE